MKNKTLFSILKALALFVSWLTLSPLLLILDGRWKLLSKWLRIGLFLVSPMMLLSYLFIIGWGLEGYDGYMRKYHYVKPHVVENIIGIKMPKYKVVKRELGYIENVTMHKDIFTLEFNIIPDKSFYQGSATQRL